ncbi:hypothetical protein IPC1389_28235 [Pseudomonas aeruginosa]|nr:hypothetical protein IPC1389_28235 [Pseudomonas aeruginosa]
MFSCSKIEQKQLNTWVSFQSAEQPLLGQFSVSGNRHPHRQRLQAHLCHPSVQPTDSIRTRAIVPGSGRLSPAGQPTWNISVVGQKGRR